MLQNYLKDIRKKKDIFKDLFKNFIRIEENEQGHLTIYVIENNPYHKSILEIIDDLPFEVSVKYI